MMIVSRSFRRSLKRLNKIREKKKIKMENNKLFYEQVAFAENKLLYKTFYYDPKVAFAKKREVVIEEIIPLYSTKRIRFKVKGIKDKGNTAFYVWPEELKKDKKTLLQVLNDILNTYPIKRKEKHNGGI